jgi:hypothetical protein
MPYREVRVGKETFVSRISQEALDEWAEVRERNRVIGYPDRPPDIDTPLFRAWIAHPNETNYFGVVQSEFGDVFPVYSISTEVLIGLPVEIKLLVSFRTEEQEYVFRRIARTLEGVTIGDVEDTVPLEDGPYILDAQIELFAEKFVKENDPVPFISTYFDSEATMQEAKLAEEELKEYYGDTKPRLVN